MIDNKEVKTNSEIRTDKARKSEGLLKKAKDTVLEKKKASKMSKLNSLAPKSDSI